jgi:predicted ATPase
LLSKNADNLNYILHGIYTKNQRVFETIIGKLKSYIPSISTVETKVNDEGKILLSFQDGNFVEPFSASVVSDGTIKVLAFLVLIYSMDYHSLLCIEEPENQLYPKLLVELAEEFRLYANKGGQVFVSTHSPDFLNAMKIEEVFWLEKKSGYTGIKRAFDNEQLKIYMENGDQMGYLWTQGFFEEVDTI